MIHGCRLRSGSARVQFFIATRDAAFQGVGVIGNGLSRVLALIKGQDKKSPSVLITRQEGSRRKAESAKAENTNTPAYRRGPFDRKLEGNYDRSYKSYHTDQKEGKSLG